MLRVLWVVALLFAWEAQAQASPAQRQLDRWLEFFQKANGIELKKYHKRHFPYAVSQSPHVSSERREMMLRIRSGGYFVKKLEIAEPFKIQAILEERETLAFVRLRLEVAPSNPHRVVDFQLSPFRNFSEISTTPVSPPSALDKELRHQLIEAMGSQLQDHYVDAKLAHSMANTLVQREVAGDYDSITKGQTFARLLTRQLRDLSHDAHLSVQYGPWPPPESPLGSAVKRREAAKRMFGNTQYLPGNIAILELLSFPPKEDAQQVVAERLSEVADAEALIVDLRANNGGNPGTVALVASYFFGERPVHFSTSYRRDIDLNHEIKTNKSVEGKRYGKRKPLYLLTSAHTFSAGEGLAYGLKAQQRATLVGETTHGGAHATELRKLSDWFRIAVPTSRAINPITHSNWERIGVKPHVSVPASESLPKAIAMISEAKSQRAGTLSSIIKRPSSIPPGTPSMYDLTIWQRLTQGGFIMFALLGLSVVAVATALALAFSSSGRNLSDSTLAKKADELWQANKLSEFRELCDNNTSALAGILREVVGNRNESYQDVNTLAGEMASRAVREQLLRTYPLTIAATLSPLIGLFGTVLGMIEAFDAIAASSSLGNPAVVASGISKALITTAAGLLVGIPALGVRHYFVTRIHRAAAQLEGSTSDLLNRWFLGRKASP